MSQKSFVPQAISFVSQVLSVPGALSETRRVRDGVIRWEGGRPASGTMTPFFLSIFRALSGWRPVRTTCAVEDRLSRVASIRMAPFAALTTTPYFKRSTSTVVGWAKSEENQHKALQRVHPSRSTDQSAGESPKNRCFLGVR